MSGPALVPRCTPFPDAPSRSTLRLHPWLPGYRHPVVFLFPLNPGQTPRPRSRSPQSGQQPASAADFPGLPLGICPLARPGFPSSTSHTSASPVGPCSRAISFAEPSRVPGGTGIRSVMCKSPSDRKRIRRAFPAWSLVLPQRLVRSDTHRPCPRRSHGRQNEGERPWLAYHVRRSAYSCSLTYLLREHSAHSFCTVLNGCRSYPETSPKYF